jgi:peptide/nickel transport system permease protein
MTTAPAIPQGTWSSFKDIMRPRLREWKYGIYRLRQSVLAMIGLALVAVYLLVAIFAPVIAPAAGKNAYLEKQDFAACPGVPTSPICPPSAAHPFGTGYIGVDLLYGVVWGARISMVMGLGVVAFGVVVGTILGGLAGYFGGRLDELIMRITDIFLAMPLLILAMGVTVALGRGLFNIGLALAVTWWPTYTRIVRGQVLSIRENQYVEAARAVGASDWRIITRHILPNTVSPIMVQATLDIGTVILISAALAFIGFGEGASNFAEWGNLVSQGQSFMLQAWWGVTIPGIAILGFALGFNLLGDGLRDLLDPRLRK